MIRKRTLSQEEYLKLFNIVSKNVMQRGGIVSNKDFNNWKNNINQLLLNEDCYFYILYNNENIVGFVELLRKDNVMHLSEIELCDQVKGTKILFKILSYLVDSKDFEDDELIQFSINKNNDMSNKTFRHLGGKLIDEKPNHYIYTITKSQVINYLNNLTKKN